MEFRALRADEIDCRIAQVKKNGLSLLLYKDVRVDQNLLDEKFGIFSWQKNYQLIGERLYCTISIKNPETGEWVSKQDVGTESYTEKEKGQASDAAKRAGFVWGIGRELYTAPFIWIPDDKCDIKENNGKVTCYDRFSVKNIAYSEEGNNRKITALQIVNERTHQVVFSMGSVGKSEPVKKSEPTKKADPVKTDEPAKETVEELRPSAILNTIRQKIDGRQEILDRVLKLCKKEHLEDISDRVGANLLRNWDKVENGEG